MNESEMDNRGSKSIFSFNNINSSIVKEQRVDGSWVSFYENKRATLRCTLMDREICYPFKIPTKRLNNKTFSTLSNQSNLNPWFITGFSDAEASFFISIYRDEKSKLKWRVTPSFSIHIHIKYIALLEAIKNTLGVGKVRKNSNTTAVFRVDNIQKFPIIVDQFNKYPLISAKLSDFLLSERCYNLIMQKQHLTQAGLEQIVSLRYYLNKGLTDELKKAFPNIVPFERPEYIFKSIPDPFWISGFVSGDSTFSVSIEKSNNKIGKRVRLIFGTCLHIRDKELLVGMAKFFNNLKPNLEKSADSAKVVINQAAKYT